MDSGRSALLGRIIKGIKAHGFTQLSQLVIRVLEVPLFLSVWTSSQYGQWLVMISVPTYLALADGGFATAAGRDMTMRLARGDTQGARSVFQSISLLLLILSGTMLIIWALLLDYFPIVSWLMPHDIPGTEATKTLFILMAYVAVIFQSSLLYGCYCAAGRYGDGALFIAFIQIAEFIGISIALICGGGTGLLAMAMIAVRLTGTFLMFADLRRTSEWVRPGITYAKMIHVKNLLGPSLGALTMPVSSALNLQGIRIIISVALGASFVAVFSAIRTMTRALIQPATIISKVAEPELAMAFGSGNRDLSGKIFLRSCQISIWMSLVCGMVSVVSGKYLFEKWTNHAFEFKWEAYVLLLMGAILNCIWSTLAQAAYATNRTRSIALATFLIYGIGGILLSALFVVRLGITWVCASLLIVECLMLVLILPLMLRLVDQSLLHWVEVVRVFPAAIIWSHIKKKYSNRS